jgi:hypothetical protein
VQISAAVWASVILAPDNPAVKQVMRSYLVVAAAALAYTWLAYLCFQDPVALQGFSSMTDLGGLTKGFASQTAVATVWAHLIAGDLFVGRSVPEEGGEQGVHVGQGSAEPHEPNLFVGRAAGGSTLMG